MGSVPRIALLSSLFLSGMLIGCRDRSPAIAVIPRTTATLLWEPMHIGAAEAARKNGVHIYWNAPADEGDIEKQLSEFALCMKHRYSGIVVAPDETLAFRSVILDAVHRKTPVVVVDDELGPPAGPLLSYVSNDEAMGARLAAERVAQILHGRGSIAIIGISSRSESGISREEQFERALGQAAPAIRLSVRRIGDTIVSHQQQIARQILDAHEADAIVTLTATATRGAYYAKIASETDVPVAIVGFDQDALIPIQSGEVDSVVVQDTRRIGEAAISVLEAQMHGETVRPVTLVPPLLLTRETINAPEIKRLWEFTEYPWGQQ